MKFQAHNDARFQTMAEFWSKLEKTYPKEPFLEPFIHKKLFAAIYINFGNNIVNKSSGGLNLMEYCSSIFGFDYTLWISTYFNGICTS